MTRARAGARRRVHAHTMGRRTPHASSRTRRLGQRHRACRRRWTLAGTEEEMGALDGYAALVTGASRGIGKGCALELGAAGATVDAAGRD